MPLVDAALCARGANPVRAVAPCGLRAPALCMREAAFDDMLVLFLLIMISFSGQPESVMVPDFAAPIES